MLDAGGLEGKTLVSKILFFFSNKYNRKPFFRASPGPGAQLGNLSIANRYSGASYLKSFSVVVLKRNYGLILRRRGHNMVNIHGAKLTKQLDQGRVFGFW